MASTAPSIGCSARCSGAIFWLALVIYSVFQIRPAEAGHGRVGYRQFDIAQQFTLRADAEYPSAGILRRPVVAFTIDSRSVRPAHAFRHDKQHLLIADIAGGSIIITAVNH